MSQTSDIDIWLSEQLTGSGERAESIGEVIAGTRASRQLIQTNHRRLVLKQFPRADEFAVRECRSYTLLSQCAPDIVAPVVAVDAKARCILLQHIEGDDLFAALAHRDPFDVMRSLGASIAQLIVATSQHAPVDETAANERHSLATSILKLASNLTAAGLPISESSTQVMTSAVAAAEAQPLALTQGDPAPSNILFTPSGARFIDFEYGATRHALFDLAQWFMRCPLPRDWFDVLASTVREQVVGNAGCTNDEQFQSQLMRMCQHAGVYMLTWLPFSAALERDRPWVGSWTVRRALLATLERLLTITDSTDPLRATFEDLDRSLRQRWSGLGDCSIDWTALIHSSRA